MQHVLFGSMYQKHSIISIILNFEMIVFLMFNDIIFRPMSEAWYHFS